MGIRYLYEEYDQSVAGSQKSSANRVNEAIALMGSRRRQLELVSSVVRWRERTSLEGEVGRERARERRARPT